jgi:hypothetical protein
VIALLVLAVDPAQMTKGIDGPVLLPKKPADPDAGESAGSGPETPPHS